MKKENVINCMFSSWYPKFKHLTIKSKVLPFSQNFHDYLMSDGSLVLPQSDSDDSSDEENDGAKVPCFPTFSCKVKETIKELGGSVFPKLNWSSPRDATWIAFNGSLKCSSPNDVYLLLKSSDYITHDLTKPFAGCTDCEEKENVQYELVLRKWYNIIDGMEFRIFVKNRKIIGISQRHYTNHYPHIDKMKEEIQEEIVDFFEEHIKTQFPDDHFVVDIYRRRQGGILVVDFNAFGEVTDPLLFSWQELISTDDLAVSAPSSDSDAVVPGVSQSGLLRYVKTAVCILPNPVHLHRMPADFIDLSHGNDLNKLVDFLQMDREPPSNAGAN